MACYSGERDEDFDQAIKAVNFLHENIYPIVLQKGTQGDWKSVNSDFPYIENFNPASLDPGHVAFQFIKDEASNIDKEVANRDETKALDVVELTSKFMKMMVTRVKVYNLYTTLIDEATQLSTLEHSSSVTLLKIQHQRGKTQRDKDKASDAMMQRFSQWEAAKRKFTDTLHLYKAASRCVAEEEGKTFNQKFNRNEYINYWVFVQDYHIRGKPYQVYLDEQEMIWTDSLESLTKEFPKPTAEDKTKGLEDLVKTLAESLKQNKAEDAEQAAQKASKLKIERVNRKLRVFQEICTEAEENFERATLEELQGSLKEIKELQLQLREEAHEGDIAFKESAQNYIAERKEQVRRMTEKISKLQEAKALESERKKNEVSANLRAMESIKLLPLTGAEDFIAWKKNQVKLNTHTDSYKKAAALLATIQNPVDKAMLVNIDDYSKMMAILNEKYNHQEKLVPAMKDKLENLPQASSDAQMLHNHRVTMNIYDQLVSIGCKESFDSSIVFKLQKKLTEDAKKDFERFKLRRKELESMQQNPDFTFSDDISVASVPSAQSGDPDDLKIQDNSPEARRLFLLFVKEEAKLLEFTKEEKKKENKEKCTKCKQVKKYCKCVNKKPQVHNIETVKKGCPLCESLEPHKNKKDKPTKSVAKCPKFKKMSLDERKQYIQKTNSCYMCLTPGHQTADCKIEGNCYNCQKSKHHPLLCSEEKSESKVEIHTCTISKETGKTYLKVSQCPIMYRDQQNGAKTKMVNVMWDTGASCNLITNKLAAELGYVGVPTNIEIITMGDSRPSASKEFTVSLMDNQEGIHKINAFGLQKVMSKRMPIKHSVIKSCAKICKIPESEIGNAKGEVQMIIGIAHDSIAPKPVKMNVNGLGVYSTNFGPAKYILAGAISENNSVEINNVEINSKNYWTGDQLGLNTDPKCSTCIKVGPCKQCKLLNQPVSFKEQEEGKIIKESMIFDKENQKISVSYPYNKGMEEKFTPANSNKFVAEKMAKNLYRSLKRDGLLETYTENFLDMEARGAIKELSPEEMEDWESEGNPINYCSHHAVLKDSKSTACRSVCNSSLSHNGTSLNAMLPKGPTAISNLLHVLIRFRAKPYTVIADLKKAYNSISTSEKDCHLRRLMWFRNEDLENDDAKLRTFGMLVMAFGDTPAQFYLECAKEEVAIYIREVMKDPELADAVISMSYVDDIALSVETMEEAESFARKLPIGFESYGFKIKEIFVGGRGVEQTTELEDQLLFGHYYNPNEDKMILKFAVNFSPKKRGQRTQPNLTTESDLAGLEMTKRKVMSLLSSQYDPLGLASVFLAKYKIFLARLFKIPEYDWDIILKDDHQKKALSLVKQMIVAAENNPSFERSNKGEGFKLSKLVAFVDASTIALQVVVYGIYTSGKKTQTSLITAKNKITLNTVPRNELQSLVAGHRLVLNVLEALDETPPEVCFLSDSTCTLDAIHEGFASKDIYVINRICEIRKAAQKMDCEVKYYHIASELNIADKGTREDCDFEYLSSVEWQHGPDFIKELDSVASHVLTIQKDATPVQMNYMMIKKIEPEEDIWESLLKRSNNLMTVLRAICIVKSVFKHKSFKGKIYQTKKDMSDAFMFLIKHTQGKIGMEAKRTKQLVSYEEDGVVFTKLRFPDHILSNVFGKDQLPVIPGKSKLAKLLLSHAHEETINVCLNKVHNGIHQTLVNSRVGLFGSYITYAKQVIKGIVRTCPVCRRQAKQTSNAKMAERQGGFGEIPPDGSSFNKIAMDYFGPFWCKPPKFKETRGTKFYKIYGMAVLCQQTRAVKFYPVEGYDTKAFLTAFEIHCSTHGVPSHVVSDPMTTFIAGAKVVGTEESAVNEKTGEKSDFETTLQRKYSIEWDFIPPGSQWRDPAERSIKSLKTMMQTIFNTEHNKSVLTINEYWNIFSQCAEILNRRPIQGYMDDETLKFICPNQLLLGRTAKEAPAYTEEDIENRPRLELLQSIKAEFWKNLMNVLAADSRLMKYPCWYSQSRKPQVGDVVLVLYKTKVNDNYRIGVIESVEPNNRDISCRVSPCQDGTLSSFKHTAKMNIPIQRTILLYSTEN